LKTKKDWSTSWWVAGRHQRRLLANGNKPDLLVVHSCIHDLSSRSLFRAVRRACGTGLIGSGNGWPTHSVGASRKFSTGQWRGGCQHRADSGFWGDEGDWSTKSSNE
jgi:hypothetical protein